mmetsp:Transcript_17119/g.53718  ORF Transcript_17119/g.53718 Transcript_17119/m.53718 type:complete len:204 (-) Transcript_17119:462-1073(-)
MLLRQRAFTMPCAATKSRLTCTSTAQMYRTVKSGSGHSLPLERTPTMRNTKHKAPGTARPMRIRAVHAWWLSLLKSAEKVPVGVKGSSSSTCSGTCPLDVSLGGFPGITPVPSSPWLCRSVERREDCTAARLPPAPFVTGAKGASSTKCRTACLRIRPPKLLRSMERMTGVQPSFSTLAVCLFLKATLAQQGARTQKNAFAIH